MDGFFKFFIISGIIFALIGLGIYLCGTKKVKEVERQFGEEEILKKYYKGNVSEQIRKVMFKPVLIQGIGAVVFGTGMFFLSLFFFFYLGHTKSIIIGVILLAVCLVLKIKVLKKVLKDVIMFMMLLWLPVMLIILGVFIGDESKSNKNKIVDYEDTPQYYDDMYDYYKDKDNWNKDFGDKYGYRLN